MECSKLPEPITLQKAPSLRAKVIEISPNYRYLSHVFRCGTDKRDMFLALLPILAPLFSIHVPINETQKLGRSMPLAPQGGRNQGREALIASKLPINETQNLGFAYRYTKHIFLSTTETCATFFRLMRHRLFFGYRLMKHIYPITETRFSVQVPEPLMVLGGQLLKLICSITKQTGPAVFILKGTR